MLCLFFKYVFGICNRCWLQNKSGKWWMWGWYGLDSVTSILPKFCQVLVSSCHPWSGAVWCWLLMGVYCFPLSRITTAGLWHSWNPAHSWAKAKPEQRHGPLYRSPGRVSESSPEEEHLRGWPPVTAAAKRGPQPAHSLGKRQDQAEELTCEYRYSSSHQVAGG